MVYSIQLLIEQSRLIIIELLEDRSHQRLTDKSAAVAYTVFLAEPVQCPLLTFIEHDTDSIFPRGFHR